MPDLSERLGAALSGRYAVGREIGRGGMAEVFLADDLKHERQVAIKVLHPELAAALGSQRFLREIQIAAKLEHPLILALIDSGEADGIPFYVMPFVEGESLKERLVRDGPLPVAEAVAIAAGVADGLDYAHRQGVVHRDIKPGNILLSDGHARIADFGVARAVGVASEEDATATGLAVGTPVYMSPEQATGGKVDARADIYALGCVLYEMLTGDAPFGSGTPAAILAQKVIGNTADLQLRLQALPQGLERVISRAMAVDPDDRYLTAAEFKGALEHPAVGGRAKRWKAGLHRRVLRAAAAIALVATGAWIAVQLNSGNGGGPAESGVHAVAVLPFENLTDDASLENVGRIAEEVISAALRDIDALRVVSGGSARSIVRAAGPDAEVSEPAVLRELRATTLATEALAGSLYQRTDTLHFVARLLDTANGEVLEGFFASAPMVDGIAAVHTLRDALLVAIATRFELGEEYAASYGQTSSYEAWKHLDNARRLWREDAGERRALSELHRAIEVDSTFDAARGLSMIWHMNLGEFVTADSIAAELETRIEQLSTHTRWHLAVLRATRRQDRDEFVQAFRDWWDRLPNARRSSQLVIGLVVAGRPGECLELLDRIAAVTEEDPLDAGYYANRAFCHHAAGQYQEALRAAREGRERNPANRDLIIEEARGLAATGQSDAAIRLVWDALSEPEETEGAEPREHDLPFALLVDVALELGAHGDQAAALELLERTIPLYRERATGESATAADRWRYARTLYAAGLWDDARALFEALSPAELAADPSLRAHNIDVSRLGYLGVAAIHLGDTAKADSIDGRLAALDRPLLWGHPEYWRAAMAAAAGDSIAATERFAGALERGLFATQWAMEYPKWPVHIDPDFEPVRDYVPFRSLITPGG